MKQIRLTTVLLLAAVMLSMLGGAASAVGSGPDSAVAPPADWQPLGVGERAWYAFNYAGDKSQIEVKLEAEPGNSANFCVWTPQNVKNWASSGGVENPIGCGNSANPHLWAGNFPTGGKYYAVVKQTGNQTANYKLTVSGKGVSFPSAEVAEDAKTAKAPKPAVAAPAGKAAVSEAAEAVPAAAGTGPGDALAATGEWMTLQPGAARWYAFTTDSGTKVQVRLASMPTNGCKFSVWTDDNIREKNNTGVDKPVGRGATNKGSGDDQMWTGSFKTGGKYYVKVEQAGQAPAYCMLQIK